jgi:hypothetical protein
MSRKVQSQKIAIPNKIKIQIHHLPHARSRQFHQKIPDVLDISHMSVSNVQCLFPIHLFAAYSKSTEKNIKQCKNTFSC